MKNGLFFALCSMMVCATGAVAQVSEHITGLHPDRRPDEAPRLTESARAPEQLDRALHGVEKPVPGNVESIAATGNWWVPLRQPGMNGAYDLRGWHAGEPVSANVPTVAAPAAR
ncbi:MAG: hypothetical protein LBP99_02045 [Azoarcus sp.]|jgi:hypothetical protein|nr:hypothetical protein [Azoarcus sp.]